MTDYKALTFINLPLLDIKKFPGDTITDEEFDQGGQTPSQIQDLITAGALSEDPDAPLHPDHQPVPIPSAPPDSVPISTEDEGKGVTK